MSFDLPPRSCFEALPAVRRARGYRLYTAAGERYLDLYQQAGRGLLGSRPSGVGLRAKSVLDKLGTGSFPSPWEGRLSRLLASRFPTHPHLLLASSLEQGLRIVAEGEGGALPYVLDPWDAGYGLESASGAAVGLWRPWLPTPGCEFIVPVLPGCGCWGATMILSRDPVPAATPAAPAFLLAAQLRAAELLFRRVDDPTEPSRFDAFPAGPWRRSGPYLFPRCTEAEYPELLAELIGCGLFPSPEYGTPSIIPAEYDEGEVRSLRRKEKEWSTAI